MRAGLLLAALPWLAFGCQPTKLEQCREHAWQHVEVEAAHEPDEAKFYADQIITQCMGGGGN